VVKKIKMMFKFLFFSYFVNNYILPNQLTDGHHLNYMTKLGKKKKKENKTNKQKLCFRYTRKLLPVREVKY